MIVAVGVVVLTTVDVGEGVALGVAVDVTARVWVAIGVDVAVGVKVLTLVGMTDGVTLGVPVGEATRVGVEVGGIIVRVGVAVNVTTDVTDGRGVGVEGIAVGVG